MLEVVAVVTMAVAVTLAVAVAVTMAVAVAVTMAMAVAVAVAVVRPVSVTDIKYPVIVFHRDHYRAGNRMSWREQRQSTGKSRKEVEKETGRDTVRE